MIIKPISKEKTMEEKTKISSNFSKTVEKINNMAKNTIVKPIAITTKTLETIKLMQMVRHEAGKYVVMMDNILDPADLNESIMKVELGLTYLKATDAKDRVELINDIIRELKNCRTIAKRMDETDIIMQSIKKESEELSL